MNPLPTPSRRGTVYGTLLNHHDALAALGDAVNAPPYKAAPKAPILYIKPRNTWLDAGDAIVVPAGVPELEIGATLGLVIGRPACRVTEADALSYVAGYVIVNDVSVRTRPTTGRRCVSRRVTPSARSGRSWRATRSHRPMRSASSSRSTARPCNAPAPPG